jgi:hypothetical protein
LWLLLIRKLEEPVKRFMEEIIMAKNKDSLQALKMQAANEVNVPLKQTGYNGDLTARQAGSVGGQMVRRMIENYENTNGTTRTR